LIMGEGRFVGPKRLEVFLNVGTQAAIPDIPGLRDANPLTHIEALELDRIPDHLIVLGGGYIGLELSQAMRRFGSRVTVIQRGGQIASREDSDVCQALLQLFQEEGVEVLLNTHVVDVAGTSGMEVNVTVQTSEKKMTLRASDLLVATGRIPNTDGIGLELTGVELDARGYVKVNEELQTTASGVWRWESVPGVRSLRMSRSTTFEWCVILWRERSERQKTAWCRFACLPTRNWLASG
jgi:pyruvate/2-oxoglutarate dehydrogenase complex dihydrolipoamide dehydrogenase (E3) component